MTTPPTNPHPLYDVLIIGSGAAGLTAALHLGEHARVALLTKEALISGSTVFAQGGIASATDSKDSHEAHIQDTLKTGTNLCNEDNVRHTINQSKKVIDWLIRQGVCFTKRGGNEQDNDEFEETLNQPYHLTREGGHSHRRILHAADATGHEIAHRLAHRVIQHPSIDRFEHHTAIDLLQQHNRCVGALVFDNQKQCVHQFHARFIVLATGGASKAYLYTTNPDCSSGDGIAMAYRSGCKINHIEFNQFHPTCLFHPTVKSFLITEAIRGEGGKLTLPNGERFMPRYHPQAELAPRDIVARAIDQEMKQLALDHVYLDISHRPQAFLIKHFPMIYSKCFSLGIDISKQPIPVVPAAHYTCGGVLTDQHGRTSLAHCYAIGEVADTGLHGANRLASNSLLECVVFAMNASQDILRRLPHTKEPGVTNSWHSPHLKGQREQVVIAHCWNALRRLMWDYVGIVRSNQRLSFAKQRILLLQQEVNEFFAQSPLSKNLIELRNLVQVSQLIVDAAIARNENVGLHFNRDLCASDTTEEVKE